MGDYAAARPYYEQALAISREVLGEKHPDTATSLNNLGYLLQAMGDYAAARPYYEQALAIRREVLGEEHPDTAQSLNNLGYLLQAMGDYAAARPYYEQALAIHRDVLGEEHPDHCRQPEQPGLSAAGHGRLRRGAPLLRAGAGDKPRRPGREAPHTATSLNNLGSLLRAMGDLAAARPYFEQALAIRSAALGDGHSDTINTLLMLVVLALQMEDEQLAIQYLNDAVRNTQILPEDHPSKKMVAEFFSQMGDN